MKLTTQFEKEGSTACACDLFARCISAVQDVCEGVGSRGLVHAVHGGLQASSSMAGPSSLWLYEHDSVVLSGRYVTALICICQAEASCQHKQHMLCTC